MQSIEYSGLWWLPSNPENKIAGSLSFNNEDGIRLRLIGAFGDLENFALMNTHPIVLGLSDGGKRITVNNCGLRGKKMSMPGFVTEDYTGNACLVGGHFVNSEQLRFRKFTVKYSHLPDWVRMSGFSLSRDSDQHTLEVVYSLPPERKVQTAEATISLAFAGNTSGDGIEELNIRQSVWFEIETTTDLSLRQLLTKYIYPLQNLLTLATTKPNSIMELQLFCSQVYFGEQQNQERIETPIQVFFRQTHFQETSHKLLIPDYMLFTLHDVFEEFQTIVERWLSTAAELDSVCHLFFGIQYTPGMYLENEFLSVVQAVESYHRRRMKNQVQPKAEHQARVRTILSRVDAADKEWLEGLLVYSNEPRLEQRLNDVLERVQGALVTVIEDNARFAKRVKNTRNYLIHFDERYKTRVARGSELYWLTRKLSYVLQICLMLELGLPLEKCAELLHRNQSFIQTPMLETQK